MKGRANRVADIEGAETYLAQLARQVEINTHHKVRLREELLRRHREISVENTQRATGTFWSYLIGTRRLTLVAPLALAVAFGLSLSIWVLQLSGQPSPQAVEAAAITKALTVSVPTVSRWEITVNGTRRDASFSFQCAVPLSSGQRLFVRPDGSYLFSGGTWYRVTSSPRRGACSSDWQWAFAELPSHLKNHDFRILGHMTLHGRLTVGLKYRLAAPPGKHVEAIAWVDRKSGLILRLERTILAGSVVVERDLADYGYTTAA